MRNNAKNILKKFQFVKFILELRRRQRSVKSFEKYYLNNPGNYYAENTFDYFQCIYIHIPKAAGVSVSKALFGNYGAGHKTIKHWKTKFNVYTFNQYFKFTIVRNPYTRLYSAYNFLKSGGINNSDKQFSTDTLKDYPTFEGFINNYLNNRTALSQIHFIPQIYFLTDYDNQISVDFIGKFENLNDSFNFIQSKIGVSSKLLHINASSYKDYSIESIYTKSMINKVNKIYKDDFLRLEYKML